MKIPIYQVDAFTDTVFRGNPAAVCPLAEWLPDKVLQSIAAENNLSETAFFVATGTHYQLRWFTPVTEVDLCGHATIASAFVLYEQLGFRGEQIGFETRSGILTVRRDNGGYAMDFPQLVAEPCDIQEVLVEALGARPRALYRSMDYMALFDREDEILQMRPDFHLLRQLDLRGIIVTAPGQEVDFVCRFFAPRCGIDEDPVTGSAYCMLAPYWADRLDRKGLTARQLSGRGGEVVCEQQGDRVLISGHAVLFLEGQIVIEWPVQTHRSR